MSKRVDFYFSDNFIFSVECDTDALITIGDKADAVEALIAKAMQDGIWTDKKESDQDELKSEQTYYAPTSIVKVVVREYYDDIRPWLLDWFREKYKSDPGPYITDESVWGWWEADQLRTN